MESLRYLSYLSLGPFPGKTEKGIQNKKEDGGEKGKKNERAQMTGTRASENGYSLVGNW